MPLIDPTVAARSASAATTNNAAAALGASASSGASGQLDNLGGEAFMKLLVAQMRYQNPMQPTDSNDYLSQISQYAMVEQMQKVNQGQQEISAYQRSMIATSFIGKEVAGIGEAGVPVSGEVLGVVYQAGRPVLVTTDGELAVDKVDEARLPISGGSAQQSSNDAPAPTGATPTGTPGTPTSTSSTPTDAAGSSAAPK
ncbi:MAG: flagellar hook capping FlgD N-terminal domain-containing protein [Acidimicrobiales bacterium]